MTAMFACAICIVACNLVRCSSQDVRREKNPVINRNGKIITLCGSRLAIVTAGTRHKFRILWMSGTGFFKVKLLILQILALQVFLYSADGTDEIDPAADDF